MTRFSAHVPGSASWLPPQRLTGAMVARRLRHLRQRQARRTAAARMPTVPQVLVLVFFLGVPMLVGLAFSWVAR